MSRVPDTFAGRYRYYRQYHGRFISIGLAPPPNLFWYTILAGTFAVLFVFLFGTR